MGENYENTILTINRVQEGLTRFIFAPGLTIGIQLCQFFMRMHEKNLLSKTDWKNQVMLMKQFGDAVQEGCIPLTKEDMEMHSVQKLDKAGKPILDEQGKPVMEMRNHREEKIDLIKRQLNSCGVHYALTEDLDKDKAYVRIIYSNSDKQNFQQFLEPYIKNNLSGGKMNAEELKNFSKQRVSIISVPDALQEKMERAMTAFDVNFADIPDMNLFDGKKQFFVLSANLETARQAYQLCREEIMKSGADDPGQLQTMTNEELMQTSKQSMDQFLKGCSPEVQSANAEFEKKGMSFQEFCSRYQQLGQGLNQLGTGESINLLQDPSYKMISIDQETLVEKGNAQNMMIAGGKEGSNFVCRIPNTKQYLLIPNNQVFFDSKATKPRYIAFVKNNEKCIIFNADGKLNKNSNFRDPEALLSAFDPHKKTAINSIGELTAKISAPIK